ncbi:hypothetical protein G6L63_21575 [Agrobacterium vitis]|uniref:Uncharacterized protein n=1 Tax=Agrobacterium vitis TaxID=373 RepID=A0A368NTM4_AGRVI|nr:hypothetical protein [Agrobacterium vitis]KAA3517486.1 hypothetical protein DXM22_07115 [Agrobacterium vitis]KAA3526887.1 hypothetical protein DXT89_13110 [Agrobacterium vitis]MCF1477099.1 hypothetical protein [Agrobacterium vitis]MUZ95717.1 hypothetical protein [Agrobacterium vitis]MVA30727.1 hypothetical protein [Agrobacterium vitis]
MSKSRPDMQHPTPKALETLADDLRQRSEALNSQLLAGDGVEDAALRAEIAEIAAGMIVFTARKEGEPSPIPALLAHPAPSDDAPQPLLDRIRALAPDLLND